MTRFAHPAGHARGDRIELRGVTARGRHGVLESERRDGQEFVVDVRMWLPLERAARTDALADTIDYAAVAGLAVRRIEGEPVDLIETLAMRIADDILRDERLHEVEVVVHKPQAPIPHPFADVSVTVRRFGGAAVVIALGANLGDRVGVLTSAVQHLGALDGVDLVAVSSLYETDPVGPEQPDYLNAVALARSRLEPAELLVALHEIEDAHQRTREIRWGARTLDLDLIQFGRPGGPAEEVSDRLTLQLPHPQAASRSFVLVPWHAVDPAAELRLGRAHGSPVVPVTELLERVGDAGVRPGPEWRPVWGRGRW